MRLIDRYAYANRWQRIDPAFKASLTVVVLVAALLLNDVAASAVAVACLATIAVVWAGIPWRVFGVVLLAEGGFLVLAALGIAISVQPATEATGASGVSLGMARLVWSPASLEAAGRVASRALAGCASVNLLALTTPLVDLIALMNRLRAPALVVELLSIVYRSIFILLDSLDRMRVAQDSRLGYAGLRQSFRSAGVLASRLFIDAYRRAQRMYLAQLSRGYAGRFNALPVAYQRDWRLVVICAGIPALMALAAIR